jgi:hypothetical protein
MRKNNKEAVSPKAAARIDHNDSGEPLKKKRQAAK